MKTARKARKDGPAPGTVPAASALDVLLENATEGISYFDGELRLVAMNRRCRELLDFPAERFRNGDPFEKFIRHNVERGEYGPGDVETLVRERVALARRFEAHDFERVRPDGTVLRIRGTPVPEGGFVTSYADITAERKATAAVRRSEELLRTILDNIPSPISLKGRDGRYLLVNRIFLERRRLAREDIVGRTAWEIFPPELARWIEARDEEVFGSGQITTHESSSLGGDGIFRHYLATRFPVLDADGQVTGLGAISVDISELVQAHGALAESEERFRDFAESSSDWLWEMDEHLRFTWFSMRRNLTNGLESPPLIGLTRREISAERDVNDDKWAAHQADLEARRPFRDFVYDVMSPEGRRLTISVNGRPVFDESGRFRGYRGTSSDVTDQRRAELARDQALQEAERANRAKSEFLATMSHELRTPLNAILGFSDILMQQYFGSLGSEKYREYASHIHSSGEHLLDLVNDLLDISIIEAGRTSLERESLSIGELIADCADTMGQRAGDRGVLLQTAVPADLPQVEADRRALKQVLLNLVTNAVKFTPVGGRITVGARATETAIEVIVADTGEGIPADRLPHITDPFGEGSIGAHKTETGWGLGLAISDSLVRLHGGTLAIESEPGVGTTITVRLPRGA